MSETTATAPPKRRAHRDSEDGIVAGVAAGLAEHLHVPVLAVRLFFVITVIVHGLGVVLYGALWLFLPSDTQHADLDATTPGAQSAARRGFRPWSWHPRELRQRVKDSGPVVAIAVLVVGLVSIGQVIFGGGVIVYSSILVALAVIAALKFLDIYQHEHAERIRSQERADVAAHLHDSVLQTLALIQRNAGDAAVVTQLARKQEQDLRAWLYEAPPSADGGLAAALRAIASDAEASHHVTIDVVVVGDAPVDEALVGAAREAVTNAAQHSGASRVDVYAEVGAEQVEVYVRDRGAGFIVEAVPEGRHGVRDSIIDRMKRHGGTAEVISTRGVGTEVRLTMPRTASE